MGLMERIAQAREARINGTVNATDPKGRVSPWVLRARAGNLPARDSQPLPTRRPDGKAW